MSTVDPHQATPHDTNAHGASADSALPAASRAQALWARLRAQDAGLDGTPPVADDMPWYLAALLGVSAWIAAGFLFGFLASVFSDLFQQPGFAGTLGAMCCVLALGLMRYARGRSFVEQFAVAASLVGQVLCSVALHEALSDVDPYSLRVQITWGLVSALALAMAMLGPVPLHRFLSGVLCATALAVAISHKSPLPVQAMAAPLLAASALGLWWVTERTPARDVAWLPAPAQLSPLAWAFTLVAIVLQWLGSDLINAWDLRELAPGIVRIWYWLAASATVALLPLTVAWLARGSALRGRWLALAVVVAALLVGAQGVAVGLALALLGFALHRPALLGVGLLALAVYLIRYYYQLDVPLLEKSGWLLAAGLVLLLGHIGWRRLMPGEAV